MKHVLDTSRRHPTGQPSIFQTGDHCRSHVVHEHVAELRKDMLLHITDCGFGVPEGQEMMRLVVFPGVRYARHLRGQAAAFCQRLVSHLIGSLCGHALAAPAAFCPHSLAVNFEAVVKDDVRLAVVAAFGAFSRVHSCEPGAAGAYS